MVAFRCFLASCSEYFYTMFSEDFRESQQNEVELHGITAAGLKALLEFAYTGKYRKYELICGLCDCYYVSFRGMMFHGKFRIYYKTTC